MANDEREKGSKEQGRRGAPEGAAIPRGTDEHSDEPDLKSGSGGASRPADRDPAGVDLDAPLGGERRDPGR